MAARPFTINNQCTPDAIHFVLAQCISGGNCKDAIFLFHLAEVFGKFDCLRVADQSAHQLIPSLRMFALQGIDPGRQSTFDGELDAVRKNDAALVGIQDRVKKIGPPAYFPNYMIAHGLGAMISSLGGSGPAALVKDFDAEKAWKAALAHAFGDCGAFPPPSPIDAKIEKLLRTIHPELFFGPAEHLAVIGAEVRKRLAGGNPGPREPAFHAALEPLVSEMMAYNNLLKSQVFQLYKHNLQEEEIASLIDFHTNGLGKKWNALGHARSSIVMQSSGFAAKLRTRLDKTIAGHFPEIAKKPAEVKFK